MRRFWKLAFALGLGLATAGACAEKDGDGDGDGEGDEASCPAGTLGCLCDVGNFCDAGLVCEGIHCLPPGSGDDTGGTSGADDGTTSGAEDGTTSDTSDTSADEDTGDDGTTSTDDGTTSTDDGTTSTDDGTTSADTTGAETSGGPGAAGEPCAENEECQGFCYLIPILGGLCGECLGDADCPAGGCTPPDSLGGTGAQCNTGTLGGGCETSAACGGGLTCALVLDVAGVMTIQSCSECASSIDCGGGEHCVPTDEVFNVAGAANVCAPTGSLPNGSACGGEVEHADAACASGVCATADIQGLAQVGVCSECESDADCGPGGICDDATVDVQAGTATPGLCQ